jgi:uncharacterized membrane protein required for colicin V production
MLTLDLILALVLILFFFSGLSKGLIRSLGRIFGLIIGAYIASRFYLNFFQWGGDLLEINESIGKILAFVILFIVATQLTHFLFYLIEKTFNLLAFIPGSKYINNILGGVLGFLEGSLFLGMIFFVISRYTGISGSFGDMINNSVIIPWLNLIVNLILPILPQAFKALQSII